VRRPRQHAQLTIAALAPIPGCAATRRTQWGWPAGNGPKVVIEWAAISAAMNRTLSRSTFENKARAPLGAAQPWGIRSSFRSRGNSSRCAVVCPCARASPPRGLALDSLAQGGLGQVEIVGQSGMPLCLCCSVVSCPRPLAGSVFSTQAEPRVSASRWCLCSFPPSGLCALDPERNLRLSASP
jgi:hypothetical protein